MKIQPLLVAVIFMLSIQACSFHHGEQGYTAPRKMSDKVIVVQRPQQHDTLCVTAVGDIMLGSSYPDKSDLPPDNGRESFRSVSKYLKRSDITFGNLEGTLLYNGEPVRPFYSGCRKDMGPF
jgi:hypothetical protein